MPIAEADAGAGDAQSIAGVITLIYKYGRSLPRVATDGYPSIHIASNLQLHLSGDVCIKVIVVQGTANEVRAWAARLISARGVLGHLNSWPATTSTGRSARERVFEREFGA